MEGGKNGVDAAAVSVTAPLFSTAHAAFRAEARRYIDEHLVPHVDTWEQQEDLPREVMRDLGAAGLLGLNYPPEYGGRGLDFGYNVVFAEELPRCRALGVPLSIFAQTHFVPPLLARLGTEEQKRAYLAPLLRGTRIAAVASSEPTGGSDIVRAIRCSAEDGGDAWVINGEKKFITNGPIADFVVTLVRTRPEPTINSLSLIIVPTDTPGFSVKAVLKKLGVRSSPTGWLEYRDCRVPKHLTLGQVNLAYHYVARNILEERLIGGVGAVALGELALRDTIAHLKSRPAFGGTLAQLQALRHLIAEMAADLEAARCFVHAVCTAFRDGRAEAKEICMIKFHVFELVQRVVERCLQLHGGSGFLEESWIARAYRDVRVLSIGGGPSELMKDLVAAYLRL
jgi:alkylation response protein AidB-like acyl-CoA dehydrogenase